MTDSVISARWVNLLEFLRVFAEAKNAKTPLEAAARHVHRHLELLHGANADPFGDKVVNGEEFRVVFEEQAKDAAVHWQEAKATIEAEEIDVRSQGRADPS